MTESQPSASAPIEIDVQAVRALRDAGTPFLLIDCREPSEHEHCRIEGSVLISMSETPDRLAEIQPHIDQPIVVHCHHGSRSLQVVTWLRANGVPQAQNMTGGIEVWSCEIDAQVPRY